jgi:CheY-like chemotaxis protein
MTRVLLVEDDPTFGAFIRDELTRLSPDIEVVLVEDRDSASTALAAGIWDVLICDLKIPAQARGLDAAVEHGRAVIGEARNVCPGTPVIVMSAFNTLDIAQELIVAARQEDIYGNNAPEPMLLCFQKGQADQCLATVKHHVDELARLGEIEVNGVTAPAERRALRVLASGHAANRVIAAEIGGGLSSARVMKVETYSGGARRARVLARVTEGPSAEREIAAYDRLVSPMLPNGFFTTRMPKTVIGAGRSVSLFYTLVGSGDVALFDVLRQSPEKAAGLVDLVRRGTAPWFAAGQIESMTVGDVRRALISDPKFADVERYLEHCPWRDVEARVVQVRRCPQHRDLHGLNVLIEDERPVLIDYGEMGEAPSALDPITLELSVYFHPKGPGVDTERTAIVGGRWWSGPLSGRWEPFVRQCRVWAEAVAAGERERLACGYAYAVRQLKYADADKELASAIACTAAQELQATF